MPSFQLTPIRFLSSVVALAASALVYPLSAQTGTATIIGIVTDSATGQRVPLATIQVQGTALRANTDTAGNYKITDIPPGTITLQVRRLGYSSLDRHYMAVRASWTHVADFSIAMSGREPTVVVTPGLSDPTTGQRVAQTPAGVITGTVKDATTGAPLDRVSLHIAGSPIGATSDANGSYVINNVPQGIVTLRATRVGYVPSVVWEMRVTAGTNVRDFHMTVQALALTGVVSTGLTDLTTGQRGATRCVRDCPFSATTVSSEGHAVAGSGSGLQHYSAPPIQFLEPRTRFPRKEIILYMPRSLPIRR